MEHSAKKEDERPEPIYQKELISLVDLLGPCRTPEHLHLAYDWYSKLFNVNTVRESRKLAAWKQYLRLYADHKRVTTEFSFIRLLQRTSRYFISDQGDELSSGCLVALHLPAEVWISFILTDVSVEHEDLSEVRDLCDNGGEAADAFKSFLARKLGTFKKKSWAPKVLNQVRIRFYNLMKSAQEEPAEPAEPAECEMPLAKRVKLKHEAAGSEDGEIYKEDSTLDKDDHLENDSDYGDMTIGKPVKAETASKSEDLQLEGTEASVESNVPEPRTPTPQLAAALGPFTSLDQALLDEENLKQEHEACERMIDETNLKLDELKQKLAEETQKHDRFLRKLEGIKLAKEAKKLLED